MIFFFGFGILVLGVRSDRIAIIGGGVAGHYAASLIASQENDVTIFESSATSCGRVRTISFGGHEFESGGSILHPANKHAQRVMQLFDLKKRAPSTTIPGIISATEKGAIAWRFQPQGSFLDKIRFLYEYGMDILYRIPHIVRPMIGKLDAIYEKQKIGVAFEDFDGLFSDLGLLDLVHRSGEEMYKNIAKRTYEDIISSVMLNNYSNQSLSRVSGLVTSVSLAGFDGDLFAIRGGNQQLCSKIKTHLEATRPNFNFRNEGIRSVAISDSGKIRLNENYEFDKIILAGPIDIEIPGVKYPQYEMEYQRTVATFVHGRINTDFFKCEICPPLILVAEPGRDRLFFNSIEELTSVDGNKVPNVFKVFSEKPLTDEQLNLLFRNVEEAQVVDWYAYPKYNYEMATKDLKFELAKTATYGIYTTQPIELGASCIEMSMISAANVANLVLTAYAKQKDEL